MYLSGELRRKIIRPIAKSTRPVLSTLGARGFSLMCGFRFRLTLVYSAISRIRVDLRPTKLLVAREKTPLVPRVRAIGHHLLFFFITLPQVDYVVMYGRFVNFGFVAKNQLRLRFTVSLLKT